MFSSVRIAEKLLFFRPPLVADSAQDDEEEEEEGEEDDGAAQAAGLWYSPMPASRQAELAQLRGHLGEGERGEQEDDAGQRRAVVMQF